MGLVTRREWLRVYCLDSGIGQEAFNMAVEQLTDPTLRELWDVMVDEDTGEVPMDDDSTRMHRRSP